MRRAGVCLALTAVAIAGPAAGVAQAQGPDPAGTIYVADSEANAIDVFAPGSNGNVAPERVIKGAATGLSTPADVKVDASGDLYVSNPGNDSVTEYEPQASGNATPICTLSGADTELDDNQGIAVEPDGTLLVSNPTDVSDDGGEVTIYAPGACGDTSPTSMIEGELDGADAVSEDGSGNVYVANPQADPANVQVYAPGGGFDLAPERTISGLSTDLLNPDGLLAAFGGKLYATSGASAGGGNLTVFASGANGNVTPAQAIAGASTDIGAPNGLALDRSGNMYVTDPSSHVGPAVLEFASAATGNVAPTATLAGSKTTFATPQGVAVAGPPSTQSPSVSTTPSASTVTLGASIHDTAQLTGGTRPTGSIIFKLFGPSDSECSQAPAFTSAAQTVDGDGAYVSPSFTPANTGSYSWVAVYGGDANNAPVTTACQGEPVTVNPPPPTVTAITPTAGSQAGGTAVEITGTNLADTESVQFGAAQALSFSFVSDTELVAVSPAGTGTVNVTVTDGGGTSKTGSGDQFTYTANRTGPDPEGTIYVADAGSNAIDVFAAASHGDVLPERVIEGPHTGIDGPGDVKVNAAGDVYSSNFSGSTITEYAPQASGDAKPICTISGSNTGLDENDDMSLQADGTLVVGNFTDAAGNGGDVEIFAAGACGNVAPIDTIEGSSTGLDSGTCTADENCVVDGVGADADGTLYTDASGNSSVQVFAPGSNGNVAPESSITGSNTGLGYPDDIIVAFNGELYVTSGFGGPVNSLTVYAPGASGNAAPIEDITGSNTDFGLPDDLAVDAHGNMYVTDSEATVGPALLEFAAGATGNVAPAATINGGLTTFLEPEGAFVAGPPASASATVTTAASASTISLGSATHDTATLAGGTSPTGSFVFKLFGPNDPTCSHAPAFTSPAQSVAGDGSYSSPSFAPTTTGTYSWQALYSGDAKNAAVTTACGATAETVTVTPATTTTTTTTGSSVPVLSTSAPAVTGSTSAAFSGTVNPEGSSTSAYFQYGLDLRYSEVGQSGPSYTGSTPVQQLGAGSSAVPVSASVPGLVPNALYHVRLVASNGVGVVYGPDQTFMTAKDPAPPPPVLGESVNVAPISGTVYIKPPPGKSFGPASDASTASSSMTSNPLVKGKGFQPLTEARQIPVGSQIDARKGVLNLSAAPSIRHGKLQTGTFGGAIFSFTQARGGLHKGQTTLTLLEGDFPSAPSYKQCPRAAADTAGGPLATIAVSHKVLQSLKSSEHGGSFRTKGKYSSATVRGTAWTTTERCDGTLTTVKRGTVSVQDFRLRKTITLHAHQSYLARRP